MEKASSRNPLKSGQGFNMSLKKAQEKATVS